LKVIFVVVRHVLGYILQFLHQCFIAPKMSSQNNLLFTFYHFPDMVSFFQGSKF